MIKFYIEVMGLIKINKSKRLDLTFEEIIDNIKDADTNISMIAREDIVSSETDEKLKEFYKEFGLDDYEVLISHKAITEMPFNKYIDLSFLERNDTYKPYTIHHLRYEPTDYPIKNRELKSYVPLIRFDESITLPMICEDSIGWMTPVLFEETTMREAVNKAHGHVLVVGLGIGFYPFNCLLKDEVKKITIIEYNEKIIELFKEFILPQFPRANDIEIIHGDAFEYLNNDYIKQFYYTFVDIWRNDSDGTVILSDVYKKLDFSEPLNIDFWIEDNILHNVQSSLFIYIWHVYKGTIKNYIKGEISTSREVENFITFDKIHNYFKKKSIAINNRNDLLDVINDKALLRDMLKSF